MFDIKKACVYTRVSTQEQANEGYSIEEQERMCKAAIESKGWEYVGTYSDPASADARWIVPICRGCSQTSKTRR
jgi:DNA invertase Pin-like site-specific DNA recombinase